jgi:hypothetical protein
MGKKFLNPKKNKNQIFPETQLPNNQRRRGAF